MLQCMERYIQVCETTVIAGLARKDFTMSDEKTGMTSLNNMTEEQMAKAKECSSPEEMLAFARKIGYDLSDEELDVISGGEMGNLWDNFDIDDPCPAAGMFRK